MSAFLSARPTKFLCLFLSLLMITLNLPDLSFACYSSGGGGLCGRGHGGDLCDFGRSNTIVEATGNLQFWSPAFTIPGRGQPLSIEFCYNSQNANENSPFGYGWMLNYDLRVQQPYFSEYEYDDDEDLDESGEEDGFWHPLTLRQADGGDRTYRLFSWSSVDGETVYVPDSGEYETITHYTGVDPYFIRELKNGTQQRFDGNGNLVLITDANGNSITIARDEDGYVQSVTDSSGLRTVTFTRPSGTSHITKITDPDGNEYDFEYDGSGDLVSFRGPGWESAVEMEYNSSHRMTSRTDVYGESVLYTYDSQGRVATRTDREENIRHYDYDPKNKVTTVTDPRGGIRKFYYNDDAKVTRIEWLDENEQFIKDETYEYGALGLPAIIRDGRGNATRFVYDNLGNRTAVINQQGLRTDFVYDEYNNVTEIAQGLGKPPLRTFTFDYGEEPERRNLASISWSVGGNNNTRYYEYDNYGSLVGYTDARGKVYDFTYTTYGNLETITDPLSNLTTLDYYDEMGKFKSITNALNFTTSYSYGDGCACNPLERIDYPDGTFTEFSRDNQKITAVTDRNGNVTRYPEYNGESRLLKMIDAMGNTADFAYDANGNLEAIEDAKANVTGYEYDDADRLVKTVYADDSYEELTYDAADNITARRLRSGAVITYAYDSINRLTLKTYPDSTTVEYDYDLLNRLTDVENYYYSLHYSYDNIDQVQWFTATDKDIGVGYTVSYQYDAEGNRTGLDYPSGYSVEAGFDDLNRLDQLRDPEDKLLADYDYDAMRRTSAAVFNSGTEVTFTSYTYDDANSQPDHLISLSNWKSATDVVISSFDYTYDNEGNRLSMAVDPAWGSQTGMIDYDYDLIYQLKGAEGPGFETYPDASFTYDSMGNRVEVVFSGQTEVYAANELNQYTEVSFTDYQYDLNGNLTDDGNQLYEYDYENRLTKIRRKSDNALIAEYRYDPFGRRAKKFVYIPESSVVNYLYDGAQVIEERNEDFEPERRFVYGPGIDEPVSIHNVISGETYFYQRDGLGSVTELTDAEGNVIERYRYSPFGKLKIYDGSWNPLTGSTVENRYFFTGRRHDSESGLYYYRARMYSQELGRFLQVDPIGYRDGLNQYRYVTNNPTYWIDPYGVWGWVGAAYGAVAGGIGGGIASGGSLKGILYGAGAGAVIGFFNPLGSALVGGKVGAIVGGKVGAIVGGALGGASASVAGQMAGNYACDNPIFHNLNWYAVVGAGIGNAGGVALNTVAGVSSTTLPGAIVEGAFTGFGELAGARIGESPQSSYTYTTLELPPEDRWITGDRDSSYQYYIPR